MSKFARLTSAFCARHAYESLVVVAGFCASLIVLRAPGPLSLGSLVLAIVVGSIAVNTALELSKSVAVAAFQFLLLAVIASQPTDQAPKVLVVAALASAFDVQLLRNRRTVIPFNVSMYLLTALVSFFAWKYAIDSLGVTCASIIASMVWFIANFMILVPAYAADTGESKRAIWKMVVPQIPSEVGFGLFGAFCGYIVGHVGLIAAPIVALPLIVLVSILRASSSLEHAHEDTEQMLLTVLRLKDEYTYRHSLRVAKFTKYIAEGLGVDEYEIDRAHRAGLMHDIGKVHTKLKYLNKPGPLDEEEWADVKKHTHMSKQILSLVEFLRPIVGAAADNYAFFGKTDMNEDAHWVEYAVSVADAFDAMTSTRAYRKALPFEDVIEELKRCSGYLRESQFSPKCVEALIATLEAKDEKYGAGHETDEVQFAVEPPKAGFGSASLGKLAPSSTPPRKRAPRDRFGTDPEPIIPDFPVDPYSNIPEPANSGDNSEEASEQ